VSCRVVSHSASAPDVRTADTVKGIPILYCTVLYHVRSVTPTARHGEVQSTKVSEQPFFESITTDSFLLPRVLYALPYPESHVPGAITSSTLEGQKSFISRNRVKGGGRQDSSTGVHEHGHFAPTCIHSCSLGEVYPDTSPSKARAHGTTTLSNVHSPGPRLF
jgi:hypothetical protein